MVTLVESEQHFKSAIASGIVLVDFFATWCGPCIAIAPKLEKLATKHEGKAKFFKVDVDRSNPLAAAHEVSAMPTFIFFVDGKVIETIVGAQYAKIEKKLEELIAAAHVAAGSSK